MKSGIEGDLESVADDENGTDLQIGFFFFPARPEKPKYLFKSLNTEGSKHR